MKRHAIFAQDDKSATWKPEFTAKAFISVYHGSYELTAGARIWENAFGLGCGYGMEHWNAIPADVKKLPVYGFYRRHVPFGKNKRILLFGEATSRLASLSISSATPVSFSPQRQSLQDVTSPANSCPAPPLG